MKTDYSKKFKKQYRKLPQKLQEKFVQRLSLLSEDATHPLLHIHELTSTYTGCASINITGNLRTVFKWQTDTSILFVAIGSHSKLYS